MMDKETVDLLIAFAKIKGSIQSQIPPSADSTININLFLIEKFNGELNVFKEIYSVTLIQ